MSAATEAVCDLPEPGWPRRQDLRTWLGHLSTTGDLGIVRGTVDPQFEVAAYLSRLDGRSAAVFGSVAGSEIPLVGNAICGRSHVAAAMGCSVEETADRFAEAVERPRPCAPVDREQAPVFAERIAGDDPLGALPIPVHHEDDAGRYLSSAVVVARDPVNGATNLSINRLQVAGPARLRALILPGRLSSILAERERRGEPLDVAICLGVDPLLMLASQARPLQPVDELEVCSALRASPLPVTEAPTVDVTVPANAEIVIEGRVLPGQREQEGPFGEYPRTYGPAAPAPVIEVLAVWHRPSPVSQTILSAGREHFMLGAIPREADLTRALRRADRSVRRLRLTEGGSCRLHLVVALESPRPGRARHVLLNALAVNPVLKHVMAVDADVDIFSDEEVEWALATRVQAGRDVVVLPAMAGGSLDPSGTPDGRSDKMLVDATVPDADLAPYRRMRVPGRDEVDMVAIERAKPVDS
jgi:2,5-furandicarboxylate decarboxylase 1